MYYCYKRPIISGDMGIKTWGHRLKIRKRGGKLKVALQVLLLFKTQYSK